MSALSCLDGREGARGRELYYDCRRYLKALREGQKEKQPFLNIAFRVGRFKALEDRDKQGYQDKMEALFERTLEILEKEFESKPREGWKVY